MAVTKIWPIHGRVGNVIHYVCNPDKTDNRKEIEQVEEKNPLRDVLDYTTELAKTLSFTTGINCLPESADEQMVLTQKAYGKDEGIRAFHAYQSFAPGEVDAETAHHIGIILANKLWGERFEVVVATHLDKAHLHNHFVINAVSFKDGKRYYDNKTTYRAFKNLSDTLCKEHALSVIEKSDSKPAMHYSEWQAKKSGQPTWRGLILSDMDQLIAQSVTLKQFLYYLRKQGYQIKSDRKYFTVKPPGKERFVRIDRYNSAYSLEAIEKRIRTQPKIKRYQSSKKGVYTRFKYLGSFQTAKRFSGLRGLYMHYCYLLKIFPKQENKHPDALPFCYREDLRQMERISQETLFLCKNKIETDDELLSAKNVREAALGDCLKKRKHLDNAMRYMKDPKEIAATKEKIQALTRMIATYRKEIRYCEGIEKRTANMRNKIKNVQREEKQIKKKERKNHEYRW